MDNEELFSNLSNNSTKTKSEASQQKRGQLAKEFHEDILNFKLNLRKNKLQNKLMEMRIKKLNNNNKIINRQKLLEFRKLFETNNIKQIKDKFIENNSNFLKDKKTIELIHTYSLHIIYDENIQKIFNLNDNIILNGIFNEIIKDLNSSSIELDLFDYYLLILGNLFIFSKNIYENKNKDFINLFLNILNKNINLENYGDKNFNIINNTLWLIHLYIYFNKSDYVTHYAYILQNIENFFSNYFLGIMEKAYVQKNNDKIFFSIIKEILYSLLNIYSIIFEDIFNNIKIMPNLYNFPNEIIQKCFDNLINILNYKLIKNIYDEDITEILGYILSINKYLNISKNNFFDILCALFNKYKYDDYDNNNIIHNLIVILNKLIDNYYDNKLFWEQIKDSDILPICIQYYLKNGSFINMTLITLNLFFKYQINYNKIIIKCINYKLIENIADILINTENNDKNCYNCLNILINSYNFMDINMKNKENIIKYFNIYNGLISKLEQLLLSRNEYIIKLSSELLYKFKDFKK